MSLFSEQLKILLQDSGQTIYKISKDAAIDRTTIQRAMTGERLPNASFVEMLCEHLRVSPSEKTKLMEYYSIVKIGETNYATRKHIKNLIEQIAMLHKTDRPSTGICHTTVMEAGIKPITVFTGEYQVNSFVRQFLEYSAISRTPLHISVPFEYNYFFDYLLQYYWDSKGEWEIEHLMKLIKNNDLPLYATTNLSALSNAFPFSFCLQNGYRPSYFYQNASVSQDISVAMPYYFFTNDCLITLSMDFKTAIVYRDSDIIHTYQQHFEACMADSTPLITNIASLVDMASVYIGTWQQAGRITHLLEPQPCFAQYYTADMIETYLKKDVENREELKATLQLVFQQARDKEAPLTSFFTIEGLRDFVETGVMANLPTQYTLPFCLDDRKLLLTNMREEIAADIIFYRVLNEANFAASPATTIHLYYDKRIMFLSAGDGYITSSLLEEKSLGDAFFDFFNSLNDSDLVYSKETTLQIIDDCLAKVPLLKQAEQAAKCGVS